MKTLNTQYQLIKEGKGHKGIFLTEAKRQFPNYITNSSTFEEATTILKQRGVINENIVGLSPINSIETKKESYESAFEAFLAEAKAKEESDKAEVKKPAKQVEEKEEKTSKPTDKKEDKNFDNMIFDQIMTGYYAEMKDPKNADKTMQELKDIVLKNLSKDPIFYTKDGQFGVKGLGYETEVPGLGTPKEPKGKYKSSGYGDLKENKESSQPINEEESKLRKVIREIVDEELEEVRGGGNYGILTINPSSGGGGRRFVPDFIPFPVNIRKRFGDHMVYNPGNGTFYVSQILYNNLVKGYADQPAIKKLIMDIPMMVKQLLNKTENYGPSVNLPKEYKVYMPFVVPVEKAKSDKFNKAGDKQYWSEGDFLFPNLNKAKYSSDEEGVAESENLQETLIRKVIRENVEKELAQINKEAEQEVLAAKLEKIEALIQKRQSQLTKLDEDEDMKDLTDKKKVKGIEKEIKTLEKAKSKLEKIISKSKGKKKEVIDEDEMINEIDPKGMEAAKTASDDLVKNFKDLEATAKKIELEENHPDEEKLGAMKDELESYNAGSAEEAVEMYLSNHPEDEIFKTQLLQLADPLF